VQALDRGIIEGVRESTKRLIASGDDLEAALNKAMSFEGVFSELKSLTDPVGFAMDNLDKDFARMKAVFEEAGASVAEYAQLEELFQLKRIDAMKSANREAEQLARDRRTLEARVAELQGRSLEAVTMLRAIELEQLDASLRPLQSQVWLLEDAAEAARAAEELRVAWAGIGDGIMEEVRRIRGLSDPTGTGNFAALLGQFNATTTAARGGDQNAAKSLAGLSQGVLTAAGLSATSRQELQRVQAQIAASLEATYGVTSMLGAGAAPSTAAMLAAAAAQGGGAGAGNDNSASGLAAQITALRAEVSALRSDLNAGQAAIAGNTGKIARKLDDVTNASGGDAISTVQAA